MNLDEFKAQVPHPLPISTLVLFKRGGKVLLAMKKRGFGSGYWNGVGGKLEEGESVWKAAERESMEEVGLMPNTLRRMAYLNFYFRDVPLEERWNQQVQVFESVNWSGTPTESDEMRPQLFERGDLPFDQMWPFDKLWIPEVLDGNRLVGDFLFGTDNAPLEHRFLPYPE